MKHIAGALMILLCAVAADAQSFFPDPDYERVLIPVYFSGPGAHDANWTTDVRVMSSGDRVEFANSPFVVDFDCPILCPIATTNELSPWQPMHIGTWFDPAGLLLWVPRGADRDTIHIEARIRDESRQSESAGTRVPVIWERDLSERPMVLLNVPVDARYRTSLRLFDLFQWDTDFVVRVYDMGALDGPGSTPLVDTIITARDPVIHVQPERFPDRPSYVTIGDLVAAYPQLSSVRSVAIEVTGTSLTMTPPPPNARFYALASVTNNATQEVTIIAPK